jgi:hypothetical protein
MFSVRTWAVYAVTLVLTALPIWALSTANGAIEEQTWLLLAIAYVLVVLTIATIRIYIRLGELIEAIAGQRVHLAEKFERPSLPPPAYGPPSVYAPHPEYDPPPPAVGRRPTR